MLHKGTHLHLRSIAILVGAALALGTTPAIAQPDAPTDAQLEQAKTAFREGKKLYEARKYTEAADKFKESYRLSKRPALLYNVALSLDEGKQKDPALFYYRKFLSDAPKDDPQRGLATKRIKDLEKELGPDAGKSEDPGIKIDTPPTEPVKPVKPDRKPKIKPPGTYDAKDFEHQVVEEAPPGKPLDLTASVPDDSGFVVTLFFRGAKDAQFTPVQMKWRYKELVGRIPAGKMSGTSVQYYIEVKDTAGTVVTKVAKPASPNVVFLEPKAPARFYPDWGESGGAVASSGGGGGGGASDSGPADVSHDTAEDPLKADTSDDPLRAKPTKRVADRSTEDPTAVPGGGGHGNGFTDVGSSKFKYTKWGTTAVGGALLATAIGFYIRASKSASTLEKESERCGDSLCPWDDYTKDVEATGKSSQTIYKVTLGFGLAVTAVAGYYWYKQLRHKTPREVNAGKKTSRRPSFIATPAVGEGLIGGAAAVEF